MDKGKLWRSLNFNQCLPHGNIVNQTSETRWTFNCRFKGLFTPYNDKKIGVIFSAYYYEANFAKCIKL